MAIIIVLLAVLLFASSFSFLAIYIEDRAMKGEEWELLSDEEFETLWLVAKGDEKEFERLAAFESKVKMAETEYCFSLSMNPRAHRRMAKLFSQWGKEWDREHGIED